MSTIVTIVEGPGEVDAIPILIRRIAATAMPDAVPHVPRPKGRLTSRMPPGRAYKETRDQPALTSLFDLSTARGGAPSFDKMWRTVIDLVAS